MKESKSLLTKLSVNQREHQNVRSESQMESSDNERKQHKYEDNKNHVRTFIVSSAWILAVTIFIKLIRGNVETNPGMGNNKTNLSVYTYNCNGLGDFRKLRRILTKAKPIVEKGGIIFLQETHVTNEDNIRKNWNGGVLSNCVRTNSAGVIILFSQDYKVINKFNDEEGRQLVAIIETEETKLIVANAYYPNDHKMAIDFTEKLYTKILECQNEYPGYETICAGDFNVCLTDDDSINRIGSTTEKQLAKSIIANNKLAELEDAYRSMEKKAGYTWNRGNCYSRLDYIFLSKPLIACIKCVEIDWALEASDHAAVKIGLEIDGVPKRGPGIVKVNTRILENKIVCDQVENEINEMMSQTDHNWCPHDKLEFLKVVIRSVLAGKTGEIRQSDNKQISELEEELNQVEKLKVNLVDQKLDRNEEKRRLESIEDAIRSLRIKLEITRKKASMNNEFISKAKWFEYGEKSNKFFLNLNKARQKQKLIKKIRDGDQLYEGNEQVKEGITKFYAELYSSKVNNETEDQNFYSKCPKLNNDHCKFMEKELTLEDLQKALTTCKDSAPGPDGIPYCVYKKFWKTCGPILLNAWLHSKKIGKLPKSHLESVITLLPKEGKDTNDIKNWRPITLSNCDAKIITKALSIKTSKVLDTIIDPSQTAYVPGRSIADNLRTNFFYKKQCRDKNLKAVLISLDAKKAFDSVEHSYIEKTLAAYGFGPVFIETFRILYKDINAKILINGFLSDKIEIRRGVKQGDALSCAIFIICIDPLLRNINSNEQIRKVKIGNLNFKAAAYADDISVVCNDDQKSIQGVFAEYEKLTIRSGLELNADKTEIIRLNKPTNTKEKFKVTYNNLQVDITLVRSLKICGLNFTEDQKEEYRLNVLNKIEKLEEKIKIWSHRHLTLEGKSLIVKTFGLSQIIYNMQCYEFKSEEIVKIERSIFKFLWSTTINPNGIDRIKRTIMKNDYSKGGLNITDIECLDRSLKLRQFIRSIETNHEIAKIQELVAGKQLKQEYSNIPEKEFICTSAQQTMNIITDHNRTLYNQLSEDELESDRNLIDEVSNINLKTFLSRKGKVFLVCILVPISKAGITTLGDLIQNYEHEINEKMKKNMKWILQSFPEKLVEIAKCYDEYTNSDTENLKYVQLDKDNRKCRNTISAKELQKKLKIALGKTEELNVINKNNIISYDVNNIIHLREKCKNAKLRNIYFRMIHNDFYTYKRMKKYNMTVNDKCPRCGDLEDAKHLLWECYHSRNIWSLFNKSIINQRQNVTKVVSYEDVFKISGEVITILVKMRIIQEMIQIERPKHWNQDNITKIREDLLKIEEFIYKHENKNKSTIKT